MYCNCRSPSSVALGILCTILQAAAQIHVGMSLLSPHAINRVWSLIPQKALSTNGQSEVYTHTYVHAPASRGAAILWKCTTIQDFYGGICQICIKKLVVYQCIILWHDHDYVHGPNNCIFVSTLPTRSCLVAASKDQHWGQAKWSMCKVNRHVSLLVCEQLHIGTVCLVQKHFKQCHILLVHSI